MAEEQYKQQIELLWKALKPFAHFAGALRVATDIDGYAWVTLANGDLNWNEAEDSEQIFEELELEGYIIACNASYEKQPMTIFGDQLKAKHFFQAQDAFNSIDWLIDKGTENET